VLVESSFLLGAQGSTGRRIVLRPAISLSLWFLWRVQNAIYYGSGYSKSAGDVRSLASCPERRANEICCSFRNLLNSFADGFRLALRRCLGCCNHGSFVLGTVLISAIDLDSNGLEQPVKLGIVQVFE
jgi:hypothetical protein